MKRCEAARLLAAKLNVSRETIDALDTFVDLVVDENTRQNLISRSSETDIWDRHILDSAQLLAHCPKDASTWLDVGTGAGFPGMVMALLTNKEFTFSEPRRRRADFLLTAARRLGISSRVTVTQAAAESIMRASFTTISARAVARLNEVLRRTFHLSDGKTTWLLHKGRAAAEEVAQAEREWDADFELLPSWTKADASIVKVTRLQPRLVV